MPAKTPSPPQDTRHEIERVLLDEAHRGEIKISGVAVVVCCVGLLFSLITGLVVHARLGLWLGLLGLGYGVYYLVVLTVLRRGWYRSWITWLSSTLEVSAATAVALLDAAHLSPAYALTSAPPYIYFLAIACTVLRLNRRLCFYAGTLAAAESAALYLAFRGGLPADLVQDLPSLSGTVYLQRSGYLFLAGLLAAASTKTVRRLLATITQALEQRRHLRWLFGRFVSDEVADRILQEGLRTQGELRDVTVLCSDVRDFSAFANRTDPREVVTFLNALFEKQCDIIARHGGRVDKFLGDGLLAIFGDPIALDDHALHAARAALELAVLDCQALEAGEAPLRLGVAVHTGSVLVGNLGSSVRLEYAAIGDTVNLAFRIEALNRTFGTSVLISEATRERLGPAVDVRPNDPARVHGWAEPMQTYELRGLEPDAT